MEVLAMGLHVKERWKLRQIEGDLRKNDPGLDALLAGRQSPGPPARARRSPGSRALAAGPLALYLVPPVLILTGLLLHATWLVIAGAIPCPFIPVIAWLQIRHSIHWGPSHGRKP